MKLLSSSLYFGVLIALMACFLGCKSETPTAHQESIPFAYTPNTDQTIQQLIAYEQRGMLDSINLYLTHANPAFRYQALHSYCTPRATNQLAKILPLLKDSVPEVRRRAIYAVGQSAKKEALPYLQQTYDAWDSLNLHTAENALVLEAIGKCGSRPQLDQLAGIQTFNTSDTALIKGQALGIFQLLLKGLSSDASIKTMTKYFFSSQYPLDIRQIAGYYLMRGKDLKLDQHEFAFGKILRSTDHFTLRANAAAIMSNSGSNKYATILVEQLDREQNEQVKINILRALYKMPYARVKNKVFNEINDNNPVISRMAAHFFLMNGQADDASQYWDKVKNKKLDPIASAYFAAATAKNLPFYYAITRNSAIQSINKKLKKSDDVHMQSQLLQVLAELPEQVKTITSYYTPDAHPAIKTQVVFAVQKAAQVAQRNKKYVNTVNQSALRLFNQIIKDKDAGALAAMAYVIRDTSTTQFFNKFRKINDLIPLLDSLDLPSEIETYNEIALLANAYDIKSVKPKMPEQFKSFDQRIYQSISSKTRCIVKTTAGEFSMSFYFEENPISVTNFITLVQSGYFNDKIFHRVIPNFVIQTGCPRGDGYGSQDYVIRSELGPLHYDRPGKVGMASAGIDTESSQWFVTHLPVFHLDGRYTIFAQIENGMNVVNAIQIGDKINSIELVN